MATSSDRSCKEYFDVLPATAEEVSRKLKLPLRRVERSLELLRGLRLVERKDRVFRATAVVVFTG